MPAEETLCFLLVGIIIVFVKTTSVPPVPASLHQFAPAVCAAMSRARKNAALALQEAFCNQGIRPNLGLVVCEPNVYAPIGFLGSASLDPQSAIFALNTRIAIVQLGKFGHSHTGPRYVARKLHFV